MPVRDATGRLPVLVVAGTRPEAIKLVPIIMALRKSARFEPVVVSTGQHELMVDEILAMAGIIADEHLAVGHEFATLNQRVANVMGRFEELCLGKYGDHGGQMPSAHELLSGEYPVATLVHGDTSSALAAAIASFHLRIPVIHVEAGLRTGGLNLTPFPEELNRQLISCIAGFHLAPTAINQENLVREMIPANQIFVTGNTGIDALQWASELAFPFQDRRLAALYETDARIVVLTAHRRENWHGGLKRIATAVARLAADYENVHFVVPVHPNPRVGEALRPVLEPRHNVLLLEPLSYAPFCRLLGRCHFVITDSGGIQEEAPSLDKPVLVARDTTERIEGVEAGTLKLVGTDTPRIEGEARRLLEDPSAHRAMADAPNPYGDGRAAQRTVAALEHLLAGGDPPEPFGSGYTRLAVLAAAGYDVSVDWGAVSSPPRPDDLGMTLD